MNNSPDIDLNYLNQFATGGGNFNIGKHVPPLLFIHSY